MNNISKNKISKTKINNHFKMPVFSAVILRQNDALCFLKRSASSISGGVYAFAGGGVDGNETIIAATIREAEEELGIILKKEWLKLVHILHVKTPTNDEYINFFFEASCWVGNPQIMEPHKFDDIQFFQDDTLPKNVMASHKHVLTMINQGVLYSEFGW